MNVLSTQSNATPISIALVGTASMLSFVGQPDTIQLFPTKLYNYEYEQKQEAITYLLKHEIMPTTFENTDIAPLIDMPIIKRIKVKFNKSVPLEFTSVEDNKGFIG